MAFLFISGETGDFIEHINKNDDYLIKNTFLVILGDDSMKTLYKNMLIEVLLVLFDKRRKDSNGDSFIVSRLTGVNKIADPYPLSEKYK